GEKEPEHAAPAPRVPLAVVEGFTLFAACAAEQLLDAPARVDQRQNAGAKAAEISLELPRAADALRELIGLRVPECAHRRGKPAAAAPIERVPASAGTRADELQQSGMIELPIGGHAQFKAR